MRVLDVGIAGCGVAGLALAALLARGGHRVVVFDALAAPRPIGSGLILQPAGLAVLDEIGVGDRLRGLGARLERLFGRSEPSGRIVLDVRYDALGKEAPRGLSVHRGALFTALYDAAIAAGAEIESGRQVIGTDFGGRFLFADGAVSPRFALAVDALGLRSPLRPMPKLLEFGGVWTNVDWPERGPFAADQLEQRYERAHKMVGVLPIGRADENAPVQAALFWSLKNSDHAAWRAAGLAAWQEAMRALWPQTEILFNSITDWDAPVFARYAHGSLASPLSRGLVHLGDSAHCASPQLGQGANMALLDAFALARALATGADVRAAAEKYARARRLHVWLYQAVSWAFTPAYQSDSAAFAWVRDHVIAPLTRIYPAPALLAGLVAGQWGAPLRAIEAIKTNPQTLAPATR